MSRYILLEGIDGCGKTSQATLVAAKINALRTKEPSDGMIGRFIRSEITRRKLDPIIQYNLFAAGQREHALEVVSPALLMGRDALSDRGALSMFAYNYSAIASVLAYTRKGLRKEVDPADVLRHAFGGEVKPTHVVYLRIPVAEALERVSRRGPLSPGEDEATLREVAERYEWAAQHAAATWGIRTVDARGSMENVTRRILEAIR